MAVRGVMTLVGDARVLDDFRFMPSFFAVLPVAPGVTMWRSVLVWFGWTLRICRRRGEQVVPGGVFAPPNGRWFVLYSLRGWYAACPGGGGVQRWYRACNTRCS
jgi:hypothetical protein